MEKYNSLKDLKGCKIIDVLFSKKPTSYSDHKNNSCYNNSEGEILLVCENGIKISFWNSEWGGMVVDSDNTIDKTGYREYYSEDERDVL